MVLIGFPGGNKLKYFRSPIREAHHTADDGLSDREIEVLQLIATGKSNKRIANHLSITEETVKGHVRSILGKLGATDRTHAVTLGLTRGIFQLHP